MRPPGYELVCRGLMLGILTSLLRTQSSRRLAKASVHGERIRTLMEDIEAAPAAGWTNRSMAALMNLHEDHFSKLFRQIAGMPPGEYLRSIRQRKRASCSGKQIGLLRRLGSGSVIRISTISAEPFRPRRVFPRAYRKLSRIL